MRIVRPYKRLSGALRALDNGGGFWNVLTREGDGRIEPAEIARAAGDVGATREALLFVSMACGELDTPSRVKLNELMSPAVVAAAAAEGVRWMRPSEFDVEAVRFRGAILTGWLEPQGKQKQNGPVVPPMLPGGEHVLPTSEPPPAAERTITLMESFHLYDDEDDKDTGGPFAIARTAAKCRWRGPGFARIGGVVHKGAVGERPVLEPLFYTRLTALPPRRATGAQLFDSH